MLLGACSRITQLVQAIKPPNKHTLTANYEKRWKLAGLSWQKIKVHSSFPPFMHHCRLLKEVEWFIPWTDSFKDKEEWINRKMFLFSTYYRVFILKKQVFVLSWQLMHPVTWTGSSLWACSIFPHLSVPPGTVGFCITLSTRLDRCKDSSVPQRFFAQ